MLFGGCDEFSRLMRVRISNTSVIKIITLFLKLLYEDRHHRHHAKCLQDLASFHDFAIGHSMIIF